MITIAVSAADLRRAYLPGRSKTGSVETNGLTYRSKPISRIVFGRYNRIEYWNGADHFATFQDSAAIDD
jgi:hypothetical protein